MRIVTFISPLPLAPLIVQVVTRIEDWRQMGDKVTNRIKKVIEMWAEDIEVIEEVESRPIEIEMGMLRNAKDGCAFSIIKAASTEVETAEIEMNMTKEIKKTKTTAKGKKTSRMEPTPCGICNMNVNKAKSVHCKGCNRWCHLSKCTEERTEKKYKENEENFRCLNCKSREALTNEEKEDESNEFINDQMKGNR